MDYRNTQQQTQLGTWGRWGGVEVFAPRQTADAVKAAASETFQKAESFRQVSKFHDWHSVDRAVI